MKGEDHLTSAKEIESGLEMLDPIKHFRLYVEGIFGASIHYIAFICERKIGKHLNTHKRLHGFLREGSLNEVAEMFSYITSTRIGCWYGGKGDGETVRKLLKLLERIRELAERCKKGIE